jgi:hypothetical protein
MPEPSGEVPGDNCRPGDENGQAKCGQKQEFGVHNSKKITPEPFDSGAYKGAEHEVDVGRVAGNYVLRETDLHRRTPHYERGMILLHHPAVSGRTPWLIRSGIRLLIGLGLR